MKPRLGIAVARQGHPSSHHEIRLRELSGAIEVRYGYPFYGAGGAIGIRLVSLDCKTIIALESGVATAIVVNRGGDNIERKQKGQYRKKPTSEASPRY